MPHTQCRYHRRFRRVKRTSSSQYVMPYDTAMFQDATWEGDLVVCEHSEAVGSECQAPCTIAIPYIGIHIVSFLIAAL